VQTNDIKARFVLNRPTQNFCLEVDLDIPGQGVTAIFGRSGSGKTSLLRCIAGLEKADMGELKVASNYWQQGPLFLPTHKRELGFVFQDAGLLEHLSVLGNLEYVKKRCKQKTDPKFYQQVLEILKVTALLTRYPQQLSGGEKQRVAIARALLSQPQLLLMDEPLASLDEEHKQQILPYLEQLHQVFNLPVLYVTHSVSEVSRLAEHVLVLEQGKLVAQGKPSQIFSQIHSYEDSAEVITMLDARVTDKTLDWQLVTLTTNVGELELPDPGIELGYTTRLRIRAKDVSLSRSEDKLSSILNRLPVTVVAITASKEPAMQIVELGSAKGRLLALVSKKSVSLLQLQPGEQLWAQVKSASILL